MKKFILFLALFLPFTLSTVTAYSQLSQNSETTSSNELFNSDNIGLWIIGGLIIFVLILAIVGNSSKNRSNNGSSGFLLGCSDGDSGCGDGGGCGGCGGCG